ncbi:hypothetical protein HWI79_2647 [Cryptosporidium felis]|nr:hypothetical protein HWI79_2647 [Cryptosporidium felis]
MSSKQIESNERFRPGDVFQGYYFPGVLCGRTLSYYRDVVRLLREYRKRVDIQKNIIDFRNPVTFEIMSQVYKEMSFSAVQFCTEVEEKEECFQILVGVTIRLFNRNLNSEPHSECPTFKCSSFDICTGTRDRTESSQNKDISVWGNTAMGPGIDSNLMDLNVSMIIMDSLQDDFDSNKVFLNDSECDEIHHNVSIIYLLFLIFKSQYKIGLEQQLDHTQLFEFSRIPVSTGTLDTIKKVIENSIKRGNIFPEARLIVYNMLYEGAFKPNIYDGPQYYYQDRYGNPLMPDPLEKRFLESENLGVLFSTQEKENDEDFIDYFKNLRNQLEEKLKKKSMEIQNNPEDKDTHNEILVLEQLINELDSKLNSYLETQSKYSFELLQLEGSSSHTSQTEMERNDLKKRKLDQGLIEKPVQIQSDETQSLFFDLTEGQKNRYGDWNELLRDVGTNIEEAGESRKGSEDTSDKKRAEIHLQEDGGKDPKNLGFAAEETGGIATEENNNVDQQEKEPDNSLLSLLNRIEELVNRKIQ